jgi:hypothetical protein
MQLIDCLEQRADSIRLIESVEDIKARFYDGNLILSLNGAEYPVLDVALDTFLNLLRIPIKYIYRCIEHGGVDLAEYSVNYWVERYGDFSFLIELVDETPTVTQVFTGRGLYLPSVKVNDLIIDYLGNDVSIKSFYVEEDTFEALYVTGKKWTCVVDSTLNGKQLNSLTFRYGVRVLYSDCFTITPRFDGILVEEDTGAVLGVPTKGRKFRVASNTIPQVLSQIEDFIDLSLGGLDRLTNSFYNFAGQNQTLEMQNLLQADDFVSRLCSDLRLSRKVYLELMDQFTLPNNTGIDIVMLLASYTSMNTSDSDFISVGIARDIQMALSSYIMRGTFK